jgi:predicted amidophosphoribosyltransferase
MLWFGKNWNAPICETCQKASTPVGAHCAHCNRKIVDGDNGVILPGISANGEQLNTFWHYICFASNISII